MISAFLIVVGSRVLAEKIYTPNSGGKKIQNLGSTSILGLQENLFILARES